MTTSARSADFPPVEQLNDQLSAFMDAHIYPQEQAYHEQLVTAANRFAPLPLMDELKAKAKEQGLWNLWMPRDHGGLSNEDHCGLAETMGRVLWSPEVFNCNAPDTGNMEVFMKYGTPEQRERGLEPLLAGEIRSSYCMTEPDVASSDATNVRTSIERKGDEYEINGKKWFITNAMYERTKILIVMGKSDAENPNRHLQQSQILVPKDTKGVKLVRPLSTLGYDDAPLGHAEVHFDKVRVPAENILLGEGRGFEIAQGRLGPGRIHHCMRSIGAAEKALELMVKRAGTREAFGKPILRLGKNLEVVSRARIEIDACRLMVLRAAKAMDVLGNKEARVYVSAVKAMVPEKVCKIIDEAIQMHGATGVSKWTPLADMYTGQRTLRLADGPDEVHHMVVGRAEARKYGLM